MNNHIEKYLDYYKNLEVSPEYAVLLRGNLGSGKTWFIKDYIKRNTDLNHLYVSLNGVSSFQEIVDSYFNSFIQY